MNRSIDADLERAKREVKDYIKLKKELDYYTSGKIKKLLEKYYDSLRELGA